MCMCVCVSNLSLQISKTEGECNWYNRKGKLFVLFDLKFSLPFKGKCEGEDVSGTIKGEICVYV